MNEHKQYECSRCKDKGYYEGYKLDGMTIYRWQKPEKLPCNYCEKGDHYARR